MIAPPVSQGPDDNSRQNFVESNALYRRKSQTAPDQYRATDGRHLSSQRSFVALMDDILQSLISAEATRGENEMRYGFTFSDPENPVYQTLQHFREEQQQVRQVLETRFYPASSSKL